MAKAIPKSEETLSAEIARSLLFYDAQTGEMFWRVSPSKRIKAGDRAGSKRPNSHGYLRVRILGKLYPAHRVAWLLHYGHWPEKHIDHANRVASDNRVCNLREATRSQNIANSKVRKDSKSGIPGVYWREKEKRWVARFQFQNSPVYVGCFKTADEAKHRLMDRRGALFGEFSRYD